MVSAEERLKEANENLGDKARLFYYNQEGRRGTGGCGNPHADGGAENSSSLLI